MPEANKLLAQRFFDEILTRQNYAICREVMAEHYVEHALAPFGQSEPGSVSGPEHAQSAAEWLHAQFPDIRMRVEVTIAEGDLVACRVFTEGTNLGPLNGTIPPTGRRFAGWQHHWFRVADNKLAEHWAVREDLPMMMQLGVILAPGRL
jgi:predicted ester cyclase